jgi:hypothetical protein
MTFEQRLESYTKNLGPKKSRQPNGLTRAQYKRLIKKLNHEFAIADL